MLDFVPEERYHSTRVRITSLMDEEAQRGCHNGLFYYRLRAQCGEAVQSSLGTVEMRTFAGTGFPDPESGSS